MTTLTVGQLKAALEGIPDEATVYVFDWYDGSPDFAGRVVKPGESYGGWSLDPNEVLIGRSSE